MENGCVGQNRKGVVIRADGHPLCARMQHLKLRQVEAIQVHDLAEGSGEVLHKLSLCIIAGAAACLLRCVQLADLSRALTRA